MKIETAMMLWEILPAFVVATKWADLLAKIGKLSLPKERRIGCLDGLRGYLALAVLAHHFIIWVHIARHGGEWTAPAVPFFNNLGAGGVALFFMTTGCVFYPKILSGFAATPWISTFVARAFRIVPLIAVSLFVITWIIVQRTGKGLDGTFPLAALTWISSLAEPPLLQYPDSGRLNAYVLWSLKYEWMFYLLVLPACAFAMERVRKRWPTWVLPVSLFVLTLGANEIFALGGVARFFPLFAAGMVAFECSSHQTVRRALGSRLATIPAVSLLLGAMIGAPDPYGAWQTLAYGFFFTCVACGNSLGGILESTGARALGECSYGIYLLHGILLSIVFSEGTAAIDELTAVALPAILPLCALAAVSVAALTLVSVERPAMRMGSAVARRLTDSDAPGRTWGTR